MKHVHFDNNKQFLVMRKELRRKIITMTTSSPYSRQSNGLSERNDHASTDKIRAMIKEVVLNKRYRGEMAVHATYLPS